MAYRTKEEARELLARYPAVKVFTKCERIMSDVWADVRRAVLLTPDGYETVTLWNSEFPSKPEDRLPKPTMASEAECAAYEAKLKAEREALEAKLAEERRIREARTIRRGKIVKVVRGRKVPKGTVGKVFWLGDGRWGTRLGIALDDERDHRGWHTNVAWTAASNCEVILDGDGEPLTEEAWAEAA